jgi:HJR/Mrr/RecB family endonuclease
MRKIAKALDVSVPELFEERDRVKILVQVNRETHEITEKDILEMIKRKRAANR